MEYNFIYKTTNLINGKIYVGHRSTDKLEDKYLGSSLELKEDIKFHGKENFKREILEFCDYINISEREKFWIIELNSIQDGYNKHIKGTGQRVGFKHKEESKRLIKENHRDTSGENNPMYGMFGCLNPNFGKGLKGDKHPLFGKHHSDETKQKQSLTKKGMYDGDKNPFYNKHHSQETKDLISSKHKERFEKFGNPRKGIKMSDEVRLKFKNSWIGREVRVCPYCGKESKNASNMYRYHFENCKFKNKI